MNLDNVVIRPAELADTDAIAEIYSALWCGWLRRGGFTEDERLVARFNTVMQAQCSPIALVAEVDGNIIAACYVGVYDNGAPRTNPYWQQTYDELLEQATARAQTADDNLEGSLFGDSREKVQGCRWPTQPHYRFARVSGLRPWTSLDRSRARAYARAWMQALLPYDR